MNTRQELSLLIWEEYLAPEVIARFERESGARVAVTEVSNTEQLKQELSSRPGEIDVVVADESTLREMIDLKQLRDLETGNGVETAGPIFPLPPSDPTQQFSRPYLWGTTVLAGKREVLRDIEPSWSLLWREDLRIALLDEPIDLVWMALLALGHDPSTATSPQVAGAIDRLADRFPDLSKHMRSHMVILDALEADEFDLVICYNGDALVRAAENPEIAVVLPREGAPLWVDSLAVTRESKVPELAKRFIEFMTSADASAETANALLYATPYTAARSGIDPLQLSNPVLYPGAELAEKCRFVRFDSERIRQINQSLVPVLRKARPRALAMGTGEADPEPGNPGPVSASDPED